PAPERKRAPIGQDAADEAGGIVAAAPAKLMQEASVKTQTREAPASVVASPQRPASTSTGRPAAAVRPADRKPADKPGLAAAKPKKPVDKLLAQAAVTVTKPVRIARTDPLAPLAVKPAPKAAKDLGQAQ